MVKCFEGIPPFPSTTALETRRSALDECTHAHPRRSDGRARIGHHDEHGIAALAGACCGAATSDQPPTPGPLVEWAYPGAWRFDAESPEAAAGPVEPATRVRGAADTGLR